MLVENANAIEIPLSRSVAVTGCGSQQSCFLSVTALHFLPSASSRLLP